MTDPSWKYFHWIEHGPEQILIIIERLLWGIEWLHFLLFFKKTVGSMEKIWTWPKIDINFYKNVKNMYFR